MQLTAWRCGRPARYFHLPYFDARMSCRGEGEGIKYQSTRTHRGAPTCNVHGPVSRNGADSAKPRVGSLDGFLTQRLSLYSADRPGRILPKRTSTPTLAASARRGGRPDQHDGRTRLACALRTFARCCISAADWTSSHGGCIASTIRLSIETVFGEKYHCLYGFTRIPYGCQGEITMARPALKSTDPMPSWSCCAHCGGGGPLPCGRCMRNWAGAPGRYTTAEDDADHVRQGPGRAG